MHIHRQSAFLFGRDRVVSVRLIKWRHHRSLYKLILMLIQVADIPVDHPSCSKQHAVLQFRSVNETNQTTGQVRRVVK